MTAYRLAAANQFGTMSPYIRISLPCGYANRMESRLHSGLVGRLPATRETNNLLHKIYEA